MAGKTGWPGMTEKSHARLRRTTQKSFGVPVVSEEYSWGDSFQQKLLALYVREPQAAYGIIEPAYFTNPIIQDISRLTKEAYSETNRKEVRLSRGTLAAVVKGYLGKKRRELWPSYRKVVRALYKEDLSDRPVILTQAVSFAKEQMFRRALVDAEKDVNNKSFDRAIKRFDDLKGFGAEKDLGIEYWKDIGVSTRWVEDRQKVTGTFYLKTLDRYMDGGLGAGELAIILAGGKVGKSTLLARFAAGALWQGKNVAIATGELSAEKYRKRIDAMITKTPSFQLTRWAKSEMLGSRRSRRKLRKIYKRMRFAQRQMKGSLWIKQWPTNKGKIRDIENWLDSLKESGVEIDILFVDYVRVFRPNERFEEQRLKIGEVVLDLRGLAVERNIPVWTASQSNRAALKKERLGPEDLAEDISQFWTLDFLIALCQTEQERGSEDDRKKGKPETARLFLTSARDVGRGGSVEVLIERDTFIVREKARVKV